MKPQIIKKYFKDTSHFKYWLKHNGFIPHRTNWRETLKYGVFEKDNRLYRFRTNDSQGPLDYVAVDISCVLEDFDRWANSTDCFNVDLQKFMDTSLDQLLVNNSL